MKKYWLLLESYVFIWADDKEILIYNALSGFGFTIINHGKLVPIVKGLLDISNLYCIELSEEDMNFEEVTQFISLLRDKYCGDLIEQDISSKKPIVIIPQLNINEDVERDIKTINNFESFGQQVCRNLSEITVYLTGDCPLNCNGCEKTYKQITWCCRSSNILSITQLTMFLNEVQHLPIHQVNFIGGSVFSYPYWTELMLELDKYSFVKNFYCHYKLLSINKDKLTYFKNKTYNLIILADSNIEITDLYKKNNLKSINHKFLFKILNLDQYRAVTRMIDGFEKDVKLLPVFTGENIDFFSKYIYQNKFDILTTQWTKKDIFANKMLNTNDFGKLILLSDGCIHSNLNYSCLGDISDNIRELIYKEMKNGKSWLRTRDFVDPCKLCLYKYICPSLSNYEIVIGKSNLCNIKF